MSIPKSITIRSFIYFTVGYKVPPTNLQIIKLCLRRICTAYCIGYTIRCLCNCRVHLFRGTVITHSIFSLISTRDHANNTIFLLSNP